MLPEGQQTLHRVGRIFARHPDIDLTVEGHTDSDPLLAGSRFRSIRHLSRARAQRAVRVLESAGVAEDRLDYRGYGDSRPRASNRTAEGKWMNRRVEIVTDDDLSGVPELVRLIQP